MIHFYTLIWAFYQFNTEQHPLPVIFRTKTRKSIKNIPDFKYYFPARIIKIANTVYLLFYAKNAQSSLGHLYVSTNKLLKITNDIFFKVILIQNNHLFYFLEQGNICKYLYIACYLIICVKSLWNAPIKDDNNRSYLR